MAAIMAHEEDGVKMDGRLFMLKGRLFLRRRAAAFGKLSMLKVFVTTGNAFQCLIGRSSQSRDSLWSIQTASF